MHPVWPTSIHQSERENLCVRTTLALDKEHRVTAGSSASATTFRKRETRTPLLEPEIEIDTPTLTSTLDAPWRCLQTR